MKLKKAFTIVELLTVVAIIAILIGLLIPSMNMARNFASEAKQRVQIASLDQAILAFRNDYGDYPPSYLTQVDGYYYCGAQKLAEAIFGWDLLGFHPLSGWMPDGTNPNIEPPLIYNIEDPYNIEQRKPRYLDLESSDVVPLGLLFQDCDVLAPACYVICDVFGRTKVTVGMETKNVGMPILYYKANPSGTGITNDPRRLDESIYRYVDNEVLVNLGGNAWDDEDFLNFITDPKVLLPNENRWPYRPDSYILISAGLDGEYGTDDDITNFRK